MSSNTQFTGKHTEHVEIKPYSVMVVDYHDTMPNFFKIFNNSDSEILCATSMYPTPKAYDFKVKAHAVKGYADIYPRSRLYLYNTSGNTADLTIHSFAGVFDPSAYFLSDFEFTVDTDTETSVNITGFSQPLPAGNNKIGNVGLSGAIPAGTNEIGKVDFAGIPLQAANNFNLLFEQILSASSVDGKTNLFSIISAINTMKTTFTTYMDRDTQKLFVSGEGSASVTKSATNGAFISELVFISNDSETDDMTLTVKSAVGTQTSQSITIKPGEVLNHVKVFAHGIIITATDNFRYAYNEVYA